MHIKSSFSFLITVFISANIHTMDIAESSSKEKRTTSRGRALVLKTGRGVRKSLRIKKSPKVSDVEEKKQEGVSFNYKQCTSLEWCIYQNSLSCVTKFLDKEKNVNYKDDKGNTPLHIAASLWDADCHTYGSDVQDRMPTVMALIQHPRIRSASVQNNDGHTPTHLISKNAVELRGILFGRAQFERSLEKILVATFLQKSVKKVKYSDLQDVQKIKESVTAYDKSTLCVKDLADGVIAFCNKDFEAQSETSDRQLPESIQQFQTSYITSDFTQNAITHWIDDHTLYEEKNDEHKSIV